MRKRYLNQGKKALKCAAELISIAIFTPLGRLARLFLHRYRNIWLIAERGYEARDNAWHFFTYMTKAHPEIHSVYMIDRHSGDLEKVKALGDTVMRGSLRHRLLLGAAERLISTHIMGYAPDMITYFRLDRLHVAPGIKVFLQHGIIMSDMPGIHYPAVRTDLFVCAAKPEYDFVRTRFEHKEGVVQLLGLCRYDALLNAGQPCKRQLLLMPTWRKWAADMSADDFKQSTYFSAIQGLMDSPRLIELLEKYDYTLNFYPHYEMQKFLSCFHSLSPRIRLLGFEGNDVQRLLIEADVLITDFSSVLFDFAYMGKPEIFYQFDEAEFRKSHYKAGYFSYQRDAFGPVAADVTEALSALSELLAHNLQEEKLYENRRKAFFGFRDQKNCERNYEAILRLTRHME